MERAGIPRKVAMEISGHKTEAVYRRYDIVVDSGLKSAAKKLTEYHKEQKPKLKVVGGKSETAIKNRLQNKLQCPKDRN
jgi:hypothetical protein